MSVLPTIHSQPSFLHWRVRSQRLGCDEIIQHSRFNRSIHQHRFLVEIVVCTEHKLAVGFNLNVNDAPVPTECHLGLDGLLNSRDTTQCKGQNDKVEAGRDGVSLEDCCLLVRSSRKPVQFRCSEIALERNAAVVRCKRAHHSEQQTVAVTSVQAVGDGHNESIQALWLYYRQYGSYAEGGPTRLVDL
jgi:hypothetical protein